MPRLTVFTLSTCPCPLGPCITLPYFRTTTPTRNPYDYLRRVTYAARATVTRRSGALPTVPKTRRSARDDEGSRNAIRVVTVLGWRRFVHDPIRGRAGDRCAAHRARCHKYCTDARPRLRRERLAQDHRSPSILNSMPAARRLSMLIATETEAVLHYAAISFDDMNL